MELYIPLNFRYIFKSITIITTMEVLFLNTMNYLNFPMIFIKSIPTVRAA